MWLWPVLWFCGVGQSWLWLRLYSAVVEVVPVSSFTPPQLFNFISVLHNLGCLVLCGLYAYAQTPALVLALLLWSLTYFGVDSMRYGPREILKYHHYVSMLLEIWLYGLYEDPHNHNASAVLWGLFWCEVSNHPLYYIYHRQKAVPFVPLDPRWYGAEALTFGGVRTGVAVYYLWLQPVPSPVLWYLLLGLWLLSLYWAKGLWQKYCRA